MSDDKATHEQNNETATKLSSPPEKESEQSAPVSEDAKSRTGIWDRVQTVGSKVGTLNWLLIVLAVLVAVVVYLSSQQVAPISSNRPAQLIIVQLNDIYRLDAVRAGKRGGLARVVTYLRQLKTQNPGVPIIVLHAGDFLSPSLESKEFHGAQMIDAMNFIHDVAPLYVVPGNHEFDFADKDKEYLTEAILKSRFPWVASNLERSDAMLPALRNNVRQNIVETFGKVRVGIFGLTIDNSQGDRDQPYAAISGDYARLAGPQIEELERAGADVIVGLTHLNIGDDHELAKLKQQHPRFLWIAGGHEHSLDREPKSAGTALITKGDSNARTIWKVSVVKNDEGFDVREESVLIDESIQPDPAFKQDIENFYAAKLRSKRSYLDTVILDKPGSLAGPGRCYDGAEEAVRDRESNWGDFLTDTMRNTYEGMTADVAVLNGGSIRIDDTICDRITFENLERTFAYETPVVFVELMGKDLKREILESSVGSKQGDGRFLQVSGVTFRREFSGGKVGIKDLQLQSGERQIPFDENKPYVVAVNDWIFNCKDGYKFREFATRYIPPGPDLRALVYAALSAQTKGNAQPLGRIIDLPDYVKLPPRSKPGWEKLEGDKRQCPAQ